MKYQCLGFCRHRDTLNPLLEATKMKCFLTAFSIYLALSSVVAIEISSKIDFDSEDVTSSDSSVDKSDPVVIVVENSNIDTRKENRGFRSSASRPRAGGNVGIRGPVKPIPSHSNYPLNPQPARPKVIKNICIIINGKGTVKPENFECKEGVCETTLTTETDEQGNVIGSVHLTVITKQEDSKVEDVPVIDGIRGTGFNNRNPTFAFNVGRAPPNPPFLDNNIPQAPVYRRDHIPRRYPSRPQSASFYPSTFGARKETPVWRPWIPSRGSVDDKIGAPLSQTNPSDQ